MFESFSFTEKIVKFPGFVLLSLSLTSEHALGSNECNLCDGSDICLIRQTHKSSLRCCKVFNLHS